MLTNGQTDGGKLNAELKKGEHDAFFIKDKRNMCDSGMC
jgi:hypothetical protein